MANNTIKLLTAFYILWNTSVAGDRKTESDGETERKDKHTNDRQDRQTDTQANRQTDRQTNRQIALLIKDTTSKSSK